MWIVWTILGIIAAIVALIIFLPVYIIIKTDEDGQLVILYKILFKTFGEHPDPNHPLLKVIKKSVGLTVFDKKRQATEGEASSLAGDAPGFIFTVRDMLRVLGTLLLEVKNLLKYCTVKKLHVTAVCAGEDAAEAAINYGQLCTIVYPFLGLVHSAMKVKRKAKKLDIRCDYSLNEEVFRFNSLISVSLGRVLVAFFKVSYKEAMHNVEIMKEQDRLKETQNKK